MKIGVFGQATSSDWGGGHAAFRRSLVKAPTPGHHVTVFEHDEPYDAECGLSRALPGGEQVIALRNGVPPIPAATRGPLP